MTLQWKKYHPLTDQNAFICLVDIMGNDNAIVQAARASYDGFAQGIKITDKTKKKYPSNIESINKINDNWYDVCLIDETKETVLQSNSAFNLTREIFEYQLIEDRHLARYLMNHSHTTPFEMVEIKFMVQVPMDHWRQWVRHRTANINEYSTRYTEALDFFQVTDPSEWRLQATNNKQGSSGFLEEWSDKLCNGQTIPEIGSEAWEKYVEMYPTPGHLLSSLEKHIHNIAQTTYKRRLALGVAKEQARKDLPLSTYTRAYWKCDLHNIFNFLRLRMDSHAQLEIRQFANCMFEIVKQLCPVACEAFEDYVLHAKKFSRMEMEVLKSIISHFEENYYGTKIYDKLYNPVTSKPASMTDREWKDFLGKLQ